MKETIPLTKKDIELRKKLLSRAIRTKNKEWEKALRKQLKDKCIPITENVRGVEL